MQINAINGVSFSGLQKTQLKNNAPSSNVAFEGEEDNKISNRSLTNATKALALSTLLTLGTAGLTSCDKYSIDEEHIYPIEIPVDTVRTVEHHYLIIPGENKVDTVKLEKGYDSPVAPIIKEFFEDGGIDTGDGKIPVRMLYMDEYRHPKVKMLFNEDNSSKNRMSFDVTTTDYDEETGEYIDGKNQKSYRVEYSTPDKKSQLVVNLKMLKSPDLDKNNAGSWRDVSTAMYDVSTGKRYKIDEDGVANYVGYFTPGDVANSIFYTNDYGSKQRYTNIQVDCITPEDKVIED